MGKEKDSSNSLKKKIETDNSLVGGTIQIRGPYCRHKKDKNFTHGGGGGVPLGEEAGQGEGKTPALSPLYVAEAGGDVGGEKLNLNKNLALLDSLDSDL